MNVLITGANRGIGFELTKFFLNDKKNRVVVISKNTDNLNKISSFKNLQIIKFDLEKTNEFSKLFIQIKKKTECIDILINNAGLLFNETFQKVSLKQLQTTTSVNYHAPFLLIQGMLSLLSKAKSAHVINISSIGGIQGSQKFKGLSSYSPSKAALIGLTECLAEELKDTKISVNCLALGAVQTDMLEKAFPNYKATTSAKKMAEHIYHFAIKGAEFYNGKVISVSKSTP